MPSIIVNGPNKKKERYEFETSISIGSAPTNTVVLKGDSIASQYALVLFVDNNFSILQQPGSPETLVNGEQVVGKTELKQNDVIAIGPYSIQIGFYASQYLIQPGAKYASPLGYFVMRIVLVLSVGFIFWLIPKALWTALFLNRF